MKKLLPLLIILLSVSLLSCQRELDEEDLIYRGDWDSKTYALQIFSNGYGVCNTRKWGGLTCEGYVTIRSNKIVFTSNRESSSLPRKKFDIDQRPQIDANGTNFMILDGERFERR
jgi:hypothetical protein